MSRKKRYMSFWLDNYLFDKLEKFVDRIGITRSQALRDMIRDFFKGEK